MIDWDTVFEKSRRRPGATDAEILQLVRGLSQPLSPAELADVNRRQRNPWPEDDPHHAGWQPFDPRRWQLPVRPLPESFLSFLRWSNGGDVQNGDRLLQMFGSGLRSLMLDYNVPEYMPGVTPFAFNGGGVFYMFDMREPAVAGEYPILCAHASCLTFDPYDSPRVADSFLQVCQERFNIERLRFGGIILTAENWPTCTDPKPMLDECEPYDRKQRLFACACVRPHWEKLLDQRFRHAVETAEQFADGQTTNVERAKAKEEAESARDTPAWTQAAAAATNAASSDASGAAWNTAWGIAVLEAGHHEGPEWDAARARQADLLREIFGNPLRPVSIEPAWLKWQDGTVVKLAQAAYDERALPGGHFDVGRMALVADALEEAGCTNTDMLSHLRGPGPHVRGCWVIDLLLGKE